MTMCRAMVRIPAADEDSEDIVVNNWGMDLTQATESGATSATTRIATFYSAIPSILSQKQDWLAAEARWYRMSDPPPRVPFALFNLGLTNAGIAVMEAPELAICVSFQGLPASGVPQARRRGRIYLGPLADGVINNITGLLAPTAVATVAGAAADLLNASNTSPDYTWSVISSLSPQGGVPINDGWVDDAPDIQRRRGYDATTRTVFGNAATTMPFGRRGHVERSPGGAAYDPPTVRPVPGAPPDDGGG